MSGLTLNKTVLLAAAGLAAAVAVMADPDAQAPGMATMDEHDHDEHGHDEHGHDEHGHDEHGHDEHDHDEMVEDLKAVGTGYVGIMHYDYIPVDGKDAVAEDLGGVKVDTVVECAEACEETEGCNGASFYDDPDAYFGKPGMKKCWLKTFMMTCEMPAEAVKEPEAILLLKPTPDCPEMTTAPVTATDAASPLAAEGPAGVTGTTRDIPVTGDDTAGTTSLRSVAAAVAVAGAMLVLA